MKNGIYFAYAIIWIATAIVVGYAIYLTNDARCLWALFIPSFIKVSTKDDKEQNKLEKGSVE